MEVKNTIPIYKDMNERKIKIQRTYVNLQKNLLKKEPDKKEQRGDADGRAICPAVNRQEG